MASVSNGKRHVLKRKETREKVCGLCLNASSCNMQNQNKYFGNSQSFPPPPFSTAKISQKYLAINNFKVIEKKYKRLKPLIF